MTCVWVAPADYSAGAPADPYVHALMHTVRLAVDSLQGQSYEPPAALDQIRLSDTVTLIRLGTTKHPA